MGQFKTNLPLTKRAFHQPDGSVLVLSGDTYIADNGKLAYVSCLHSTYTCRDVPDVEYVNRTVSGSTYASGENIAKVICQVSHGLNVQDVVGFSGTTYNKPIADGTYDGEVLGIVSECYNADCFQLISAGYISGLTSLTASTTYFLSDATAGLLTATEPITDGHVSLAMLLTDTTVSGWVLPFRPYIITTGDTGGGSWGTIVGNISDQTDLWTYLTGSTATTYNLSTPATCTVGGITAGTQLTGKTAFQLFEEILAPYIEPTFSSFDFNVTSPIEVGDTSLSGVKTFTWNTSTSGNVASNSIGILDITSGATLATGLANDGTEDLDIGTKINTGQTTWNWRVSGCSTCGTSFTRNAYKCSIYPYYFGSLTGATRPPVTQNLVTGGTKCVLNSNGTVTVDFDSTTEEYTWLAIPYVSTSKTCWYVNELNMGCINTSPSDKYPDECQIFICSAEGCWTDVCYKVYMSGAVGEVTDPLQFIN